IGPENHFINWQQDPFGNFLARVVFPERVKKLSIEVDLIADMTVINPFDFFVDKYAKAYPFKYDAQLKKELLPYLELIESGPLLRKWVRKVADNEKPIVDFLVDLNRELQQEIFYRIRMEPGIQPCETTLKLASGSCRDSGWLLVQILRHLGLAARFVSGYLVQLTADQKSLDGPSGPEKDFTDLHAWCEVYVPGAGWLGLDPTSGLFAGEGHIPLACTPDPVSAAPVTGYAEECKTQFYFHNEVQRIHEDPRVTMPYSTEQWAAINALGQAVDEDLTNADVRLTMGGEPTFVSIDDMESAQWNIAALGEHKLWRAHDLFERLSRRYGEGGLLHYGQGKWYPGEPLPRWALSYYWRKDGVPIWRNQKLVLKDDEKSTFTVNDVKTFAQKLAQALGLSTESPVPGYEDPVFYLWKEGNLPDNLEPLQHDLKEQDERRKVLEKISGNLNEPRGFALPVEWDESANQWQTSNWIFRRKHMYLIPGDSPMGLRLPLDSLPWESEKETQHEQSLFEALPPLGDYVGEVTRRFSSVSEDVPGTARVMDQEYADGGTSVVERHVEHGAPRGKHKPGKASEKIPASSKSKKIIHTAICVELRDKQIYIFFPPLTKLEHYLDLVASVESVAEKLNIPVRIEGYAPPKDSRINTFSVTPDPGVIEVNIHPAHSWDELLTNTNVLYEQARLARLGTEKFMLDGRHTGTGGGNHVTIGGPTPADSPILRRPDLLQSLVTYWQHHPGLSYLFSGLFIGPTSQAPRVDEAKHESLYELEIAFQQIPDGEVPEPWLVDRLLRNLLVDVTGNTHRSEFCIDKLYSPGSATGRLGIVEFRAFEMPPHAQMSLVQMLLLRMLIARFWKQPYQHNLVRWGTQLHDRYMLPHYVWADIKDVACDMQRAGYPFQLEWLAPFLEFRFPHYGTVHVQDIKLELQAAIEPWHVLGEEVTNVGTARFVDSSLERLQVKVTGLTDSRYVVTCNGRRVPLHNTGTQGEYVAGVRYRAWQPPSALHPTIGVHSPLVMDIIDTWNGRSIGGCTYHVAHPGGRNYEVLPVNAYEAETRRISRFWAYGHTPGVLQAPAETASMGKYYLEGRPPGPMSPPIEEINPEYPYTLDLRRQPGC
ncbi:MAG: transglutaminase family protein, partial [Gammaproteobacteria bacterium]